MRLASLAMVLVAIAGCGEEIPRTQVMVFVRAEDGVRTQANRLEVEVGGAVRGGLPRVIDTFVYTDASSEEGFALAWPVRIALVPQDADPDRVYSVAATASDASGPIARTDVISGYLDRETLTLDVWLRDDCLGVVCGDDETCVAGACGAVVAVDPCTLQRYDAGGTACGIDAGVDAPMDAPADTAPTDTSVDTGIDPLATYNVAFVSSMDVVPGDLDGVENADALCQMLSERSGSLVPPATYRAFMHGNPDPISERLNGQRGWVRPDGLPFVDTLEDIYAGRIYYPIRRTESNVEAAGDTVVSGIDWDLNTTGSHCDNWSDPSQNVFYGDRRDGTVGWLRQGVSERGCDELARVYCFGTGRNEPLPPPPMPPKDAFIAFLSSATIDGRAGLTAFDDLCQSEAEAAGYMGRTFRALVRDGTTGPVNRISGAGPWYRPDGVIIGDRANLNNNALDASLSQWADGFAYRAVRVWTGSTGPTMASGTNCSNWQAGPENAAHTGWSGDSTLFIPGVQLLCNESHQLYCFQTEP